MATVTDQGSDIGRNDRSVAGGSQPPDRRSESFGIWWALIGAVAVMALVFAMVGLFLPARDGQSGGAGDASPGQAAQRLTVELGDLSVRPNMLEVQAGRPLMLTVTNASATMVHDLKLGGTVGTGEIPPGGSEEADFGVVTDGAQAWCTIPGHKEAGMVLTFHVVGSAGPPTSVAAAPQDQGAAAGPADAVIDPQAKPAATWTPFDPALQPAPGGVEHRVTLSATETTLEVAPGVTQEMWTFDGQSPGPILRGNVGDVFTVTLRNDGEMGHSIDFHASQVAWSDEMRTIQPGESLVYQFRAEFAGMFMYHCGTAPALHHIGNGMFGAIIIDPPALPPVDHEYVFVQSELYLGPQGQPGDLTKMQKNAWDAVVFNGYYNQYAFAPIQVEPGERIRAWVLDAGPSENSSFHVVGTVFDTVYLEGHYELRPSDEHGGSQALGLQPAQGGFVEFSLAEQGQYPIVTHKFSNVGKGALGLFQAGHPEPAASGSGH